jgi:diguanylate cyclase (GGDEF)-like protein
MTRTTEQRPRILVVDDDAGSRLLMRSALERGQFSVVEAPDGAAAVALVGQDTCDAVLMDVEMPRMDGFTACATIREMPHGANLPIMMVTGRNDLASVDRAYEVGATDFLPKPINWGLLAHRVRYLVRGGRLVQDLNASERRHRALLGAMPDLLLVVDSNDRVVDQLGATAAHPLIGPEGAHGRSLRSLVGDATAESLEQAVGASRSMGRRVELEFDARTTQGERRFETRVLPYDIGRTLLLLRDVTERHHSQARIHELAYFDALTKLPNRQFFEVSLAEAIAEASASGESFALIRIGVEGLKRIHDGLGSAIGDGVTVAASERLQAVLTPTEVGPVTLPLARIAADEFVVLARHIANAGDVEQLNRKIVQSFMQPVHYRQRDFFLTTFTGASLYPDHAADVEMLMRSASAALGVAKDAGAVRSAIYDKQIHDRATSRLELETDLHRALEQNELFVVYQPQIDIASGRIVAVESLVRWRHPTRGIVPPIEFIPIAEEAGLIERLSEFVLRESLRQVAEWRANGAESLRVAVNISGLHFGGSDFARWVESELAAAGMPGSALELEITESMLIADEAAAGRTLAAVRALGVHVAIDDFGTGYSSLAYLKNFALESLKVDRSFVADLARGRQQAAICSAIIAMGRQLGLIIVAEGVESLEQLSILRDLGCTLAQGYVIARPLPAEEVTEMLALWRAKPGAGLPGFTFTGTAPLSDAEAEAVLQRGSA